jgi:hypothetical protein
MSRIIIRSGGQTGVDRAALDVAVERGLDYCGWCPQGGWAEDCPEPPGILGRYPLLSTTAGRDPKERTERNVRDSDATLLIVPHDMQVDSPGSATTERLAHRLGKHYLVLETGKDGDPVEHCVSWIARLLESCGSGLDLNIAGPRESESPGIYAEATTLLRGVLDRLDQRHPQERR